MRDIKKELLKLEFNVNSIGIIYWIEAIKFVKKHPLNWGMMEMYEAIAKKHNTTITKVERDMRFAIIPAKKNIQNKYGYYKPIKNQTFLGLIKFKLI